jgi:hypothetical protein
VRFGWRAVAAPLGACLAFVVVGCAIWSTAPLAALLSLLFFGGGAVVQCVVAPRRNLAFRVDRTGIALGHHPMRREVPGRAAPWSDIDAVVLFAQVAGPRRITCLGLPRTPELSPLPGSPGPGALSRRERYFPGLPREVLACSVSAGMGEVDEQRLARAIELNAPRVRLVDLRN